MTETYYKVVGWADIGFNSFSYGIPIGAMSGFFLLLFSVGCIGLGFRATNLLALVVFGELLLVSGMLGFAALSRYYGDPSGQLFALLILNAIAVESSIGLVLILNTFKVAGVIYCQNLNALRG